MLVLLMGQIPIGQTKIGDKFFQLVRGTVTWGEKEIRSSAMFANFAQSAAVNRWVNNVYPPNEPPKAPENHENKETANSEDSALEEVDTFTATDRESILRLLD